MGQSYQWRVIFKQLWLSGQALPLMALLWGCGQGANPVEAGSVQAGPFVLTVMADSGVQAGLVRERTVVRGDTTWEVGTDGLRCFVSGQLYWHDPRRFSFGGKTDSLEVHFLEGFQGDHLQLFVDEKLVVDEVLYTSPMTGLATAFSILRPNPRTTLSIGLESAKPVATALLPGYDYIYLDKQGDTIRVTFSNRSALYF